VTDPIESGRDRDQIEPAAVIDIGSNSVRLVAYERLARAPSPIFNEKVLAGLGRAVASSGPLPKDGVAMALSALRRFRALADQMNVKRLYVVATAASRDASDGPEFLRKVAEIVGVEPELISGQREARLSAMGVISGIHQPDGLVGDLGGGSLELVSVHGDRIGSGVSLKLGGLALVDSSGGSLRKAEKLVQDAFKPVRQFDAAHENAFYAVGGTWRALAKLHMQETGHPLQVLHGYTVAAREMIEFCRMVQRVEPTALGHIESISSARRPLLAYGALVLEAIIRNARPQRVVFSAFGVREGLLYELLDEKDRAADGLIAAAAEFNTVRSRSPAHGYDLCDWTDRLFDGSDIDETPDERRLRHAACLLSDVGWRAHPDYRGELSYNMIAHAALAAVDHPGRIYMALAVYLRHMGIADVEMPQNARALASSRLIERAKILGAAMRVGYILSAAMGGHLPQMPLVIEDGALTLRIPEARSAIMGDKIHSRMRQLSRQLGLPFRIEIEPGVSEAAA
jgi:exopolyphosphatase/guanosine-5'-triphosphate,3'-diphosphate pyrophosphatase